MVIIRCPKCDRGHLIFDSAATYEDYYKTGSYVIDDHGEILDETIQKYLVYKCDVCFDVRKLTNQEIEEMVRKEMAKKVVKMRNLRYIQENAEPDDLRASNVMVLCGECDGFDGEGRCPDRFFNRCALRKKAHGIQLP
jgi:hypothetical protein